jgi:hypothetical protein
VSLMGPHFLSDEESKVSLRNMCFFNQNKPMDISTLSCHCDNTSYSQILRLIKRILAVDELTWDMSLILFYVKTLVRPPLWSSGQSPCLQIQRSGFDSRRYQIFLEVVGLERGPLSLVRITEELLERTVAVPV